MCNSLNIDTIQLQYNSTYLDAGYPDRQLSGSAWPFGEICQEFYKTNLSWNYRFSDQIRYSVMASGTSNQSWSKAFGRKYVLQIVTAELQTADVAYFQRKIQLFLFPAYPDGSSSQLNRIKRVLLYYFYYSSSNDIRYVQVNYRPSLMAESLHRPISIRYGAML